MKFKKYSSFTLGLGVWGWRSPHLAFVFLLLISVTLAQVGLEPVLINKLDYDGKKYFYLNRTQYFADAIQSGVSRNNGDQSKSNLLSNSKSDEFQAAYRNIVEQLFSLTEPPDRNNTFSVPQYMLDLYRQKFSGSEWPREYDSRSKRSPNSRKRRGSRNFINTIRSFRPIVTWPSNMTGEDDEHAVRLSFNVSSIPEYEVITRAELRLNWAPDWEHTSLESLAARKPGKALLSVYHALTDHISHNYAAQDLNLLDSKRVKTRCAECWDSFDVTAVVDLWRGGDGAKYALRVVGALARGWKKYFSKYGDSFIYPHNLRKIKNLPIQVTNETLLVVYTDDKTRSISKHELKSDPGVRRHRKRSPGKSARSNRRKDGLCSRRSFYVDFSELGWDDWIVAPSGYQAYVCQGECPFYMPDHLNTTNHAIVQTLVHSVNSRAVPRPCCVPTELSPISMLYVESKEKVTIKNYPNMVVEACGCR